MMKHELIERYIYAVTSRLPAKMREDVKTELGGLIADMLEERCGKVAPEAHDVEVILTELGAPDELAAKYSDDERRALISGVYYVKYKFVLRVTMLAAAFGLITAMIIAAFMEQGTVWYVFPFRLIGSLFTGEAVAFGIVTLLFAIFERNNVNLRRDWLYALPPVPRKQTRIRPWEPVGGIVLGLVFAIVFLACPQIMGWWLDGRFTPLLDAAYIREMWYIVIVFTALGVGREILKLIEGQFTKRLAGFSVAANIVSIALTFIFFANSRLMNPAFAPGIQTLFSNAEAVAAFFANFHIFFTGVIVFALMLDSVVTIVKARAVLTDAVQKTNA